MVKLWWEFAASEGRRKSEVLQKTKFVIKISKVIFHLGRDEESLDYGNEIFNDLVTEFPEYARLIWYIR